MNPIFIRLAYNIVMTFFAQYTFIELKIRKETQ